MPKNKKEIEKYLRDFDKFRRKCNRESYTDVDIAWAYLYDAHNLLVDTIKDKRKKLSVF